jgi:hypothetical protein
MTDVGMENVCSSPDACQVPPNIACENEIAELFECVIDNLAAICTASGQGNGNGNGNDGEAPLPPQQTSPCQDVMTRFEACAEANGLNDDGPDNTNPCRDAPDDCSRCTCEAGADQERQLACFDAGKACAIDAP